MLQSNVFILIPIPRCEDKEYYKEIPQYFLFLEIVAIDVSVNIKNWELHCYTGNKKLQGGILKT